MTLRQLSPLQKGARPARLIAARKAAAKKTPAPGPALEPKGKKRKAEGEAAAEPDFFSQVCHCDL